MNQKILLQELYKNEKEIIHRLLAIRAAIKGFGGSLKTYQYSESNNLILKCNSQEELDSQSKKVILMEMPFDINYEPKWTLEEKINYSLNILKEADVDRITDFIIIRETNLSRKTLRNSVSNRTSLMNKEKKVKSIIKKQKGRKEKHIYTLI